MRFELCGLDPTDRRALELHRFHARHARRPGEIVTLIESVESVASVPARAVGEHPDRERGPVGRSVVGVGPRKALACRGAAEGLALDSLAESEHPIPGSIHPSAPQLQREAGSGGRM